MCLENDICGTADKFLIIHRYDGESAEDYECHIRASECAVEYNCSFTSTLPSHDNINKNYRNKG